MTRCTLGCLALGAVVGAAACSKSSEEAPGASVEMADQDAQQAMGLYAEGFNVLVDEPQDAVAEYMKEVPAEGPEPETKYRLFPHHMRAEVSLTEVSASFEKAADVAPTSLAHIRPLADQALAAGKAFVEDYKRAHRYYDSEDFKDDGGKLGKELHAKLVEEAGAFGAAVERVEGALSKVEAAQAEAEIAHFADDKGYGYWFRLVSSDARKLLDAPMEAAAFGKAHATLTASMQGLSTFLGQVESPNVGFKAFVQIAERFDNSARKMKRELEGGGDQETVQRLRKELVDGYNAIVGVTNSLRQLEANGALK